MKERRPPRSARLLQLRLRVVRRESAASPSCPAMAAAAAADVERLERGERERAPR